MPCELPVDGPVYVGGLDRSGKTIMSAYLTSHSRIAIPGVGSNLWTYFYRQYGDLAEPANLDRCLEALLHYKQVQYLEPDPDRVRLEFRQGPPTYARLFSLFLIHFAQRQGKPRWGAQTGLIERYADELFDAYAGLRIIHMVRDPRDRYRASLEARPNGRLRSGGATARWLYSTKLAERHQKNHRDQYLVVRFEDLITGTQSTLREVCSFLGEEYEPEMLEMRGAPELRDRIAGESPLLQPEAWLSSEHIGRFRGAISNTDLAFMQLHAGRRMEAYGYEREPVRMTVLERIRFPLVDWPNQLARMALWRGLEAVQQLVPRYAGRRPRAKMIVGTS